MPVIVTIVARRSSVDCSRDDEATRFQLAGDCREGRRLDTEAIHELALGHGSEPIEYQQHDLLPGIEPDASEAVTNAIVHSVARAAETLPQSVVVSTPGGSEPITHLPVILASAQGTLGAAIAIALLRRFTARPVRNLWTVGGVVTLLSLIPVVMIPKVPTRMMATLGVMHLVAAVVSITVVSRLARP